MFQNSNIGCYILNSFKVTIPTVIGAVALSCLTGYALAVYKFKSNLIVFFMFIAGNFVPFQILAIPVRDLTLKLGMYNTTMGLVMFHVAFQTGFCTLFMRNFIKGLPFALIESAQGRRGQRMAHLLAHRHAADAPGDRRTLGSDLHLHLE